MKPIFSLSSACAAPPSIKLAAVAIANNVFFMFPALLFHPQNITAPRGSRTAVQNCYLSGTKDLPSDAGVFIIVKRLLREMITRTTMVAI